MSRKMMFLLVGVMALILAGCEATNKSSCCGTCQKAAACDKTCPRTAQSCNYCTKSEMLLGQEGTVHCDKCNKDIPAGKWCSACNRIMLEGSVHCDKCNKDVPKGQYCSKCNKYVGVPGVAYCAHCKKPYNEAKGCPGCAK